MNNFVVRFLYEASFELLICAFINISSRSAPGGEFWWIVSLMVISAYVLIILALFSLYFCKGPYVYDTYAKGTILESFWGVRPLHGDIILQALTPKPEELEDEVFEAPDKELDDGIMLEDAVNDDLNEPEIEHRSREMTNTMFNSNIPLNQKMSAPVDLDQNVLQMLEGGETMEQTTERGMTTERGLIV